MAYLIGVDVGTSGAKALLCDEAGKVLATVTSEYPAYTPRPLWSEQNPEDWWTGTCQSVRNVIAEAGVSGDNIFLVRNVYHYTGEEAPADREDTFLLPSYVEGQEK